MVFGLRTQYLAVIFFIIRQSTLAIQSFTITPKRTTVESTPSSSSPSKAVMRNSRQHIPKDTSGRWSLKSTTAATFISSHLFSLHLYLTPPHTSPSEHLHSKDPQDLTYPMYHSQVHIMFILLASNTYRC